MKNFIILIAAFLVLSSTNIYAQRVNKKSTSTILVTKSMANKIADECLNGKGYALSAFYAANSKYLTFSDIAKGKGREILKSLEKYPKYSENFIRKVHKIWGYDGLKEIGFTDAEIAKSKKIINKLKSE